MGIRKRAASGGSSRLLQEIAHALAGSNGSTLVQGRIPLPPELARGRIYEAALGRRRWITVEVDIATHLVMAVGDEPPPWSPLNRRLSGTHLPVYVPEASEDQDRVHAWLSSGGETAIVGLGLQDGDRVSVFEDGLLADLRPDRTAMHIVDKVRRVTAFARTLPSRVPQPSRQLLPPAFGDLRSHADQWAIADDAIRSDELARASNTSLESLVAAVAPRLEAIQSALDVAPDPLTDEHQRLQWLTEAASDAQMELMHRAYALPAASSKLLLTRDVESEDRSGT